MRPVGLIHLIIGAEHQIVFHAQQLRAADQIPGDVTGFVVKAAIGIGAPRDLAAAGVHRSDAHFVVVVAALVPAEADARAPAVVELPVIMRIQRFVMAPGVIGGVVEPILVANIHRLAVDKRRTAIVRNVVAIIFVTD